MIDDETKPFGDRLPKVIRNHQNMLQDGVRNKLLYGALSEAISETTRFLDIGSGTGVWAIVAAKLGARRVVAVEIQEGLIPIIHQHAKENGVADKIEIIHASSDDVEISEKFDVIVSELFVKDVFGQKTVESLVKIRERFLAEDGILIPQGMERFVVPIRIHNEAECDPENLPIKCDFLNSIGLNYPKSLSLRKREDLEILAEPKKLLEMDFREIGKSPSLKDLSTVWNIEDISRVNAFAIYNHSIFTNEIKMDAFKSRSWTTGIYQFEPFSVHAGEIEFRITLDTKNLYWHVSLPSHPEIPTKSYSPGIATGKLLMTLENTPYQRF